MGIVVRCEIVQRVLNLFLRVLFDEFEIRFAAEVQAPIMMRPNAVSASHHAAVVALAPVPEPGPVRVLIKPGPMFVHACPPQRISTTDAPSLHGGQYIQSRGESVKGILASGTTPPYVQAFGNTYW